jgi:hypothetical protein
VLIILLLLEGIDMRNISVSFITLAITSEVILFGALSQPSYAACKEGVFNNLFNGEVRCAADQAADEIQNAGVHALSPNYWSTYTALNTLKEGNILRDGGQCYAAVDATKEEGSLAASAYGIPPQVAGVIATISGDEAKIACNAIFAVPSSEQIAASKASAPFSQGQNLQTTQAQYEAGIKIAELQMQGKVEEAKVIANGALEVERTKQAGETERATIQSEMLLRMTEMNNQRDLELAYVELQKVQIAEGQKTDRERIHAEANTRIAQLQAEGRVKEAEALRDAIVQAKEAEAQAQKATSQDAKEAAIKVADIQYSTLLQMTRSTNEVALKKAQLAASNNKLSNILDFAKGGIINFIQLEIEKEKTRREIALLELEIKKLETQNKPTNQIISQSVSQTEQIEINLTNNGCSSQDYYVDGRRVIDALGSGQTVMFRVSPGQHETFLCTAGTNSSTTCSERTTYNWTASTKHSFSCQDTAK